jgi:hypothetical protein
LRNLITRHRELMPWRAQAEAPPAKAAPLDGVPAE